MACHGLQKAPFSGAKPETPARISVDASLSRVEPCAPLSANPEQKTLGDTMPVTPHYCNLEAKASDRNIRANCPVPHRAPPPHPQKQKSPPPTLHISEDVRLTPLPARPIIEGFRQPSRYPPILIVSPTAMRRTPQEHRDGVSNSGAGAGQLAGWRAHAGRQFKD